MTTEPDGLVAETLGRLLVKLRFQEGTFSVDEQCDFRAALEYAIGELTKKPSAADALSAAQRLVDTWSRGYGWDTSSRSAFCQAAEALEAALLSERSP